MGELTGLPGLSKNIEAVWFYGFEHVIEILDDEKAH